MNQSSTKLYSPVTEAIRFGWNTVRSHLWFFVVVTIVFLLVEVVVPSLIKNIVDSLLGVSSGSSLVDPTAANPSGSALITALILDLADIAIVALASIYYTRIALLTIDSQRPPTIGEIFNFPIATIAIKLIGGVALLYAVLLGIPVVLIVMGIALGSALPLFLIIATIAASLWVIAAVYFAIKYSLFNYLIIDRNEKIFKAFKLSAAMTHKTKIRLTGLGLLLALINAVGALCLLVGLLVTIPLSSLALTYTYRKLLSQIEENSKETINQLLG